MLRPGNRRHGDTPSTGRGRGIPILMYHSIGRNPSRSIRPLTVTPEDFSEQMEYLHCAGFKTLTLQELIDARTASPSSGTERPVVITFDDGFADFAEEAAPRMKAVGLKATLFVTADFLAPPRSVKSRGWRPPDPMLTWSQLEVLHEAGIEIGGHCCSHVALDTLSRREIVREVQSCKDQLEERLGAAVTSFAYPFGHANRWARAAVRDAGYSAACGVKHGMSSWDENPFDLTRLVVGASTSMTQIRRSRPWAQDADRSQDPPCADDRGGDSAPYPRLPEEV